MCLDVKKQKVDNDWLICTLKCSKQCAREVFIRVWTKNSKRLLINVFRDSAAPRKVYGWWVSKLNLNNKKTEDSFGG